MRIRLDLAEVDIRETSKKSSFFFADSLTLRLIIMRSDSELLVFIFRSEKRMGLLMKSDFAKSDGITLI